MTRGYSTSFVQSETVELARRLGSVAGLQQPNNKAIRTDWSKDRIIKFALKQCQVSRNVLQLNPKAIYLGALDDSHIAHLQNSNIETVHRTLTVDQASAWWVQQEMSKVVEGEHFDKKLSTYKPSELKLSRTLKKLKEKRS